MFDWLRKLIKKKPKQTLIKIKPAGVEPPTPEPKTVQKGIVTATSVYEVRKELEKLREEATRKQFLPEPNTRRITHTHSYIPPAERHRDAISKAMKGKASNRYIKTIKQSPKIKIEEEEN